MNRHVPEDLLSAFVEGDLSDELAGHVAEHLDGCPRCAGRAATLDPLARAFARAVDPVPSPLLVMKVLDRAARPEPRPALEIAMGSALLAAGLGLVLLTDDLARTSIEAGRVLLSLEPLTRALAQAALGSPPIAVVLTVLSLVALGISLGAASLERPLTFASPRVRP
jgi:anti-sigma factor RsiW